MDWGNAYYGSNVPCDVPPPQDITVEQKCPNGHTWKVVMDYELGGYFYYNEDEDPFCPECGEEDIESARTHE